MRRLRITMVLLIAAAAGLPMVRAGDPLPATRPVPHGAIVRGRITIGGGLDLVRPDLTRAVVYIDDGGSAPPATQPASTQPVIIGQRNKQFTQNFVVVPRGTVVEFPNWDHFDHNVFSRSKAAPAFDLDRYPYGYSKSRTFTKVGLVQVFCNIHPSMRTMIFVTPTEKFSRVDADGRFELKDLSPGRYELVAWHERCIESRKTIEITSDGPPVVVDFALQENSGAVMSTNAPRREGYGGVERGLGVKRERLDLPVVEDAHPAPAATPPSSR